MPFQPDRVLDQVEDPVNQRFGPGADLEADGPVADRHQGRGRGRGNRFDS